MDIKLQLGDESSLVKTLQEKLKQLGFYNPVVTGKIGEIKKNIFKNLV